MIKVGTQCKNQVKWSLRRSQLGTPMIKLGQMVLKGVNWVHNPKIKQYAIEQSIGYTMIKLGHMVLKGVNWIHNAKSSYGLERSQLVTQ